MAVVYTHQRLDNNEVFYVGIGKTPRRAFSKNSRNKYWKHITNKTEYIVDILHSDVNWNEACELEKDLIFIYGRKDLALGTLVNMTDGGDGNNNIIISEESRHKMSESAKGKVYSEETRQKLREANTGKTLTDEQKQKISEAGKGRTTSNETRKKLSLFQRNKEGVKGYTFDKSRNKYQAQIKVGGKQIQLGRFNTPEEAELAYKQGKLKYHI
jgi:predicted transcriptional regulator